MTPRLPENHTPTWREAVRFWGRLGLISFGGPAGQIAIMHRELVEEKKWVTEPQFLHALNYCMLLPGPEAQQLATYLGWRMHGVRGGVVAGALFVLPSALLLWGLSYVYAAYGNLPVLSAIFYGLKCVVLALVIEAVLRLSKRALRGPLPAAVAVLAFFAIFEWQVPFPFLVVGAALIGWAGSFVFPKGPGLLRPESGRETPVRDNGRVSPISTVRVAVICLLLWWAPLGAAFWVFGGESILFRQGIFFSQAALVTFGGAYAVLPYVADHAVSAGWVGPEQMMAGLALAESTPGPLIMVLQFVGFLGGWQNPMEGIPPLVAATLCAVLTTWCTFLPSFLFILVGAPYVERLRGWARCDAALTAVTAAVVGVILNLALWFGSHLLLPFGGRFDGTAAILALLAWIALNKHVPGGVLSVIVAGGAAGWLVHVLGWAG
ncbi:MAG: chromate efflux transporter [Candidatus Methylacidiphilales bacterium]|nr:chromate efflux transporter [Candidatus Methylacidiphilales bacterium]